MFDAHCHLHLKDFDGIREEVLRRARRAGVTGFLTCGVDDGDWEAALELSGKEPDVFAAVGIHPWALRRWPISEDQERTARLASFTASNRSALTAVGECGLDARLTDVPMDRQLRMLAAQLEAARSSGLPVVLHCVRAQEELRQLLQRSPGTRGILHGFSGSLEQAKALLKLGDFTFSFGGALTLPSQKRRALIQGLPAHLILAETDAPDGPAIRPQSEAAVNFPEKRAQASCRPPDSRRPLEPQDLVLVAEAIAQLRGGPADAWMAQTHANAAAFLSASDSGRRPNFHIPKE